jgi:hypothetical protein
MFDYSLNKRATCFIISLCAMKLKNTASKDIKTLSSSIAIEPTKYTKIQGDYICGSIAV